MRFGQGRKFSETGTIEEPNLIHHKRRLTLIGNVSGLDCGVVCLELVTGFLVMLTNCVIIFR